MAGKNVKNNKAKNLKDAKVVLSKEERDALAEKNNKFVKERTEHHLNVFGRGYEPA